MNWPSSASDLKTCPTSNSATSPKPRAKLAFAAAIRPGSRLGRMSERSAAMGLASASSGAPPPKISACALATKDHVTASTMPRAASARRAARTRFCNRVSTGPEMADSRSSGTGAMRSRPARRMISSTRSALPSMSGRQLGARTWTRSALLAGRATAKPSFSSVAGHFAGVELAGRSAARLRCRGNRCRSAVVGHMARDEDFRRLAAAQLQHQSRRQFERRAA